MRDYITKRPMLLCGVLCCFIAVAGYYYRRTLLISGIMTVILIAVGIINRAKPTLIFSLIMVLVMVFSTIFAFGKIEKLQTNTDTKQYIEFVVCDITYESPQYSYADIEIIEGAQQLKGAKVSVYVDNTDIKIGKAFKAEISLKEVEGKYKLNNYSKGVYLSGTLNEITALEGKDDFVLTAVGKIREYIKDTVFGCIGYDEAATLCALIFGDNSYFSNEFYGNVKTAGVSHVMVVSGMHLSIFVELFTLFLEKVMYNRHLKALCMITVVLLLTALCGFTMSMLRAGVTYALVALALLLGRQSTAENTLGAATVIILISSPLAIFNVAFQLSALSTFGILAVAFPVIKYISENGIIKHKLILGIASSVIVSLAATLLTLPVSIYVFGYISLVGPLTNLLISNAVTVIIWLAVAALAVNLISGFAAEILLAPCELLLKYVNYVINKLGSLELLAYLPQIAAVFALFLIIIIFWLLLACKKRRDMLKLKEIQSKIIKEGGKRVRWQ